ncbi:MAG: hypothetical protein JWO63_1671, partial [Frankiales bacterium]|nr:hypothetical protein [Frankiales bacterium]
MRQPKLRGERPALITEAPLSNDEQFDRRRRRYLITMGVRSLCVIGAAATFQLSGWLAAAFIAAGMVLPWTAVLIANDRPPKKALQFRRFLPDSLTHGNRELTAGPTPF